MKPEQIRHLTRDLAITFLSVLVAIILAKLGLIDQLIRVTSRWEFLTEFFAGVLFTSTFTTPLAIATFLELGQHGYNPYLTAMIGGFGAVLGDYLIFTFVKDALSEDLTSLAKGFKKTKIGYILKSKLFYWLTPLLAALIIASPLPDEIGVSLLGISRVDKRIFLIISFSLNTLGILALMLLGAY